MVETGSLGYTTNMGSIVLLAEAAEAIDTIGNGLDALFATGMSPADDRDAIQWITELETLSRRVAAAQTGLVAVIDRDNLHAADGHAPAKVMVRHHAKLSEGDAKARTQVAAAQAVTSRMLLRHGRPDRWVPARCGSSVKCTPTRVSAQRWKPASFGCWTTRS